jgi:hypothetical protein
MKKESGAFVNLEQVSFYIREIRCINVFFIRHNLFHSNTMQKVRHNKSAL